MRDLYSATGKLEKTGYFEQYQAYGEESIFATRSYHEHRQKRKLTFAFYQPQSIYKPVVEDSIRERVHAVHKALDSFLLVSKSASVDIYPIVNHYTFDNITRLAYGQDHGTYTIEEADCEERQILRGLKKAQFWAPVQLDFPLIYRTISASMALLKVRLDFLSVDHELVQWNTHKITSISGSEGLKELPVKGHSVLSRLCGTEDANGLPLSKNYIACELLDNINAAQETTGTSLCYMVYQLSRHPEWQLKVREELRGLPPQADGYPSFTSIDAAPILEACVREVYRLNPVSSGRAERTIPDGGRVYSGVYLPSGVRFLFAFKMT
jgi:hypothetical protein